MRLPVYLRISYDAPEDPPEATVRLVGSAESGGIVVDPEDGAGPFEVPVSAVKDPRLLPPEVREQV